MGPLSWLGHKLAHYLSEPRSGFSIATSRRGLLAALVVEVDAGRPAGEDTGRVGSGPTVPDEDDGGHAATLRPNAGRC